MRFCLTSADGTVLDEGDATVEMAGGALAVSPAFGQPLRIAPSDIVAISEPEPYVVRLTLAEGPSIELRQLGAMRTRILAELADARGQDIAGTLLLGGIGTAEVFSGAVDGTEAEIRLYDDALVTVPASGGDGEKVPYPFILGVTPDPSGYRLAIDVAGRDALRVHQLARRTSEFSDLLSSRHRTATARTSAFLAALLPGLGPIALRGVSGLLRDGLAGARTDLDAIDPTIWSALTGAATITDRIGCLRALERMGPVWIGFKQMVSVEREAEGVTPWADAAITPDLGGHDGGAGSFGSGFGGMVGAGIMSGGPPRDLGFSGPFQAMGSALALSMLGTGGSMPGGGAMSGGAFGGSIAGDQHEIRPRADVDRGRLTAARTDYDALSATGAEPTVLAFALCLTGGHLIYEVLNEGDHATYVYRAPERAVHRPPEQAVHRPAEQGVVAGINRALDLVGFRVEGVYQDASSAGSKYRKAAERLPALRVLRDAFVGRVIHTEGWPAALAARVGS